MYMGPKGSTRARSVPKSRTGPGPEPIKPTHNHADCTPKETWCCVRLPRCGFGFFPWTLRLDTAAICRGWASPEGTSNATPFWSRGHASVEGACCWGPPDEIGCLLSYRQLISGCRRVRYPPTTDALFLSHDVRSLLSRKEFSAWRPSEEFGASPACDQ